MKKLLEHPTRRFLVYEQEMHLWVALDRSLSLTRIQEAGTHIREEKDENTPPGITTVDKTIGVGAEKAYSKYIFLTFENSDSSDLFLQSLRRSPTLRPVGSPSAFT